VTPLIADYDGNHFDIDNNFVLLSYNNENRSATFNCSDIGKICGSSGSFSSTSRRLSANGGGTSNSIISTYIGSTVSLVIVSPTSMPTIIPTGAPSTLPSPTPTHQPTVSVKDSSFWSNLLQSKLTIAALTIVVGLTLVIAGIAHCTKKYRAKRKYNSRKARSRNRKHNESDEYFDDDLAYNHDNHGGIGNINNSSFAELGKLKTRSSFKSPHIFVDSGNRSDNITFFYDNPMVNTESVVTTDASINAAIDTANDKNNIFKVSKIVSRNEGHNQRRLQKMRYKKNGNNSSNGGKGLLLGHHIDDDTLPMRLTTLN
jgi:hypothetical protein